MTKFSKEKRRSVARLLGAAALAVFAGATLAGCVVAPHHHRPAPPVVHHPHYQPVPGPAVRPVLPPRHYYS